jgi:hypothetical protein
MHIGHEDHNYTLIVAAHQMYLQFGEPDAVHFGHILASQLELAKITFGLF